MANDLDLEKARHLFNYDPESGQLTWVNPPRQGRAHPGMVAGTTDSFGYLRVTHSGKLYRVHRIAWALHYGEWPKESIDHINGIKSDNRIANLRHVSHSLNLQNQRRAHKGSSSGVLGVNQVGQKFRAAIRVNGAVKFLGVFSTKEEAHAAYLTAKREIHPTCSI